jgi:hypothetical protein
MTPEMPLRHAIEDPDNPVQLIGSYRHAEFPGSTERTPAWESAIHVVMNNLHITINFGRGQEVVLTPNTEKYDTTMQASRESVDAILTARAALAATTQQEFHTHVEKLKRQYASIVGHVRHMFFVDLEYRPLYPFVERAM